MLLLEVVMTIDRVLRCALHDPPPMGAFGTYVHATGERRCRVGGEEGVRDDMRDDVRCEPFRAQGDGTIYGIPPTMNGEYAWSSTRAQAILFLRWCTELLRKKRRSEKAVSPRIKQQRLTVLNGSIFL